MDKKLMSDLISRKDAINEIIAQDGIVDKSVAKRILIQLTSAEPKKGRWIRNDNGTYSCSVCQSWIPEEQHYYARYCLYCGAKMEEEE